MTTSSSLTDGQEMAVALTPILPALGSIMASILLIRLSTIKHKLAEPTHRILFAMSCYDISNSVTIVLQSFLVPRDTSRRYWAVGNDQTCTMLGFLFQFNYSSSLYFAVLTLYYMLSIRCGVTDAYFARRVEPALHCLVIMFPTTSALYLFTRGVYGEVLVGAGCWIQTNDDCDKDCTAKLEWFLGGLPMIAVLILVIGNNATICCHVRKTLHRSARRSLTQSSHQERIAQVATQCSLYVAVFIMTYLWTAVLRARSNSLDEPSSSQEADLFAIMMLRAIWLPAMGIGNLLASRSMRAHVICSTAPFTWTNLDGGVSGTLCGTVRQAMLLDVELDVHPLLGVGPGVLTIWEGIVVELPPSQERDKQLRSSHATPVERSVTSQKNGIAEECKVDDASSPMSVPQAGMAGEEQAK